MIEIPFHDLTRQNRPFEQKYRSALTAAISDGNFILGEAVAEFEKKLSRFAGLGVSTAVGSGTDALYLALEALKRRPGSDKKKYVVTTPMSYIASTSSIYLSGLTPIFCDVDESMNLCPKEVEGVLQNRDDILAVLLVHLGGIPAAMTSHSYLRSQYSIPVVEDCAQAFGTQYAGVSVGALCDFGAFSFHPLKVFSALGDAGVLAALEPDDVEFLRLARNHGHITRDNVQFFSHNMRMDAIQARFLSLKMEAVDDLLVQRNAQVEAYKSRLTPLLAEGILNLPKVPKEATRISYNFFMIKAPERASLQKHMAKMGVETKVHYERLLPDLNATKNLESVKVGSLPNAQKAAKEIISLPLGCHLEFPMIEYICETITNYYRGN